MKSYSSIGNWLEASLFCFILELEVLFLGFFVVFLIVTHNEIMSCAVHAL